MRRRARSIARRAKLIAGAIIDEAERSGLAAECGVSREMDIAETLTRLDAWMCDLKEMRIGDGLHVFGARRTAIPRATPARAPNAAR